MDLPLHRRRLFALNSKSFYLLLGTFVVTACLVASFLIGVKVWQIGFLALLAWCPIVGYVTMTIYRLYGTGPALLLLLLLGQTAHFFEHLAQMIELHIMGLSGAAANGIIGQLNNEWVHLIWNTYVLLFCFFLFYWLRKNPWLYVLFIFGIWHEAEHLYIISRYIQTGVGGPGLIAKGGFFFGGLPIARPDLHFYYAVFEETLLILAYASEIRRFNARQRVAPAARAA